MDEHRTPDTPTDSAAVIDVLANIPTAWNGDTPWKYLMDQGDAEVALLKLREAGYVVVVHDAMKAAAMADLSELERQVDSLTAERDAAVARADAHRRLLDELPDHGHRDCCLNDLRAALGAAERGTDR